MFNIFTKTKKEEKGSLLSDTDTDYDEDLLDEVEDSSERKRPRPISVMLNKTLEYLNKHEGEPLSYRDIANHLGYAKESNVSRLILSLLEKGKISRRREGHDWFYTVHEKPTKKPEKYKGLRHSERAALEYVREHEGEPIVQTEMAKKVGYASNTMSLALRMLGEKGLITRKKVDEGFKYWLTENDEPVIKKSKKLSDAEKRILGYLTRNQNQLLTQQQIGKTLDIPQPTVSVAVRHLENLGYIERSVHTLEGTRYRTDPPVDETTERPTKVDRPKVEPKPDTDDNGKKFVGLLESLTWDFMRETHSTNLLVFLDWVESKGIDEGGK